MMEIAILFGGVSYEHEISIISAISLKKVLRHNKKYIFCDKEHNFYLIPEDKMIAKHFSSGQYKNDKKLSLQNGGFYLKNIFNEKKVDFDVSINIIHGADGEDGTIPALFDFFKVPYIGPRKESSVVSFSKVLTKYFADMLNIKTLDFQVLTRKNLKLEMSFPVIIKPSCLGSSIGVSVVEKEEELEYALDVAFEFDDTVIAEPFVDGVKEYNLAGCKVGNEFIYSIIEEPQKEKFLDFDKKYKDFSRTKQAYEANLSKEVSDKIHDIFNRVYEPYFNGALIRCDFFVVDDEVYLNEINPNPGSLANYLFEDFSDVIEKLAKSLPKLKNIPIEYSYIHSINSAKGKA